MRIVQRCPLLGLSHGWHLKSSEMSHAMKKLIYGEKMHYTNIQSNLKSVKDQNTDIHIRNTHDIYIYMTLRKTD